MIADYLQTPLTDDELEGLVEAAVAETGATSMRDMGTVMKRFTPQVAGRRRGPDGDRSRQGKAFRINSFRCPQATEGHWVQSPADIRRGSE